MPSVDQEALRSELVTLFLAAAATAARRLPQIGVPLTIPVTEQAVKRKRGNLGGWQSEWRQIQENILVNDNFALYRVAPLLDDREIALASQCAALLVEMPGAKLPFFAPIGSTNGWMLVRGSSDMPPSVDYDVDPAGWAERHVLLPALLEHLKVLPSLDAATAADGARFAAEVISFVLSDGLRYKTTVPLAGIAIAASRSEGFTADNARLYPLSEDDQGELVRKWGIGDPDLNPFQTLPLVGLELMTSTGRTAQNQDTREDVTKWLCALQLNGYKISGRVARFEPAPRWFMPMSAQLPVSLPSMVHEWRTITPSAFEKIRATAKLLEKYNITQPRASRDFALHRFSLGASRQNSADAVVDFVVTLEALLLPYDPDTRHGDLSYRFRMHGSHYLSKTKAGRTEVFKQLRSLYGLRSGLVHGGEYPKASDIEEGRRIAGELARRGLLRALSEGFPKAETFNAMIIGA